MDISTNKAGLHIRTVIIYMCGSFMNYPTSTRTAQVSVAKFYSGGMPKRVSS